MIDDDDNDAVLLTDLVDADGNMRVQRQRCGTCIYWGENRMTLAPGRKEQMEADADAADGFITCHQTLPYSQYDAPPAVCHGYWRHAKWTSFRLRIAALFGAVSYVEPPCTTWSNPLNSQHTKGTP